MAFQADNDGGRSQLGLSFKFDCRHGDVTLWGQQQAVNALYHNHLCADALGLSQRGTAHSSTACQAQCATRTSSSRARVRISQRVMI